MKGIGRTIRRRRKEGKTDYKSRLSLLKSGKQRLVVRLSNRYVVGQIVSSEIAQDKVIYSANSKELLQKGWPESDKGRLKNLSAAYLTGFLLGKKTEGIQEVILDIGLRRNIKKSRIYAFLKGFMDSGIQVNHDEKVLPEEEMIASRETGKLINKIKEAVQNG